MTLGGVRAELSWPATRPHVLRRRGVQDPASAGHNVARAHRSAPRIAVLAVAICCLALGVLGFIAGPTTDSHLLGLAGRRSGAALFGLFQVSALLNVLHLACGALGVAAARSPVGSRRFLRLAGLLFLALSGYGAMVEQASAANVLPTNGADAWLHGAFAAVLALACGLDGVRHQTARPSNPPERRCRAATGHRRTPPSPPDRPRARAREVPLSRGVQCWSRTRPSQQRSKT